MEKKKENLGKINDIKADLYSRANTMNGKYKAAQLGLDLMNIKNNDLFFLETLKMKADLADKIINEAEVQGENTADPNIMKKLGEKINALGKPIHKNESIMTAIFVSLQLVIYYGIAIGIWGIFFRQNFLTFSIYGLITGLLISFFIVPIIARQRTRGRIRDMVDAVSITWGNIGMFIGVLGVVALVIKFIFLKIS